MRTKVPFPRGPGDWRYDPTTGVMVDAAKLAPITVPADGTAADLTSEEGAVESVPIEQIDDADEPETVERTAGPGAALPEIPSVPNRRKRAKR